MTQHIPAGTIVDVVRIDEASYAVVVDQPDDMPAPNDHETFIWVRYDNGCVVPIRDRYIHKLTSDQVAAKLNELVRSARNGAREY